MILAGDIGGTKTLLALYNHQGECLAKQQYSSQAAKQFSTLLDDFLSRHHKPSLSRICLGVAGPIVDGNCITTNLPWHVTCSDIKAQTGTQSVTLLNDLQATSWGLLHLPETDFETLNSGNENPSAPIAVLAAGTGLGEAIIVKPEGQAFVMSTEGGHSDFAAQNEQDFKLLQFLQNKYGQHISYERVVSGMGIADIYDFLVQSGCFPCLHSTEQRFNTEDKASVISQQAIEKTDPLCIETMQIFCRCYGAEAGNLALKTLSYGGVLLAGGIAAKNLPLMKEGSFIQAFTHKGRYHELLNTIPVKICLNPEAALYGAYQFALHQSS
jgi:glucokinase